MSEKETWKPVVGFEGLYEVSDLGRVRSLDRELTFINRWGSKTTYIKRGKILKAYKNTDRGNYMYVNLHNNNEQHMRRVHRLVVFAFIGNIPSGLVVCHNNNDPSDNRLFNLRLDTYLGNSADQLRFGTRPRGQAHNLARLTDTDVRLIKSVRGRVPQRQLADEYGVTKGHINNIQCGFRWRHV